MPPRQARKMCSVTACASRFENIHAYHHHSCTRRNSGCRTRYFPKRTRDSVSLCDSPTIAFGNRDAASNIDSKSILDSSAANLASRAHPASMKDVRLSRPNSKRLLMAPSFARMKSCCVGLEPSARSVFKSMSLKLPAKPRLSIFSKIGSSIG